MAKGYIFKDGSYYTVLHQTNETIIDPIGDCEEVVLENCTYMNAAYGGEVVASEMVPRNGWINVYYDDVFYDDLTGEPLGIPRFIEVTPESIRALV